MPIDSERLDAFLGKAVCDLGAATSATLMLLGDRLGLYKALAAAPLSSAELAARSSTNERYIREWLNNQAAGGYVEYDPGSGKYSLSPEQALCLADPHGPVDLPGAYFLVEALFHALQKTEENFRTGRGMEWGEHHPCLFHGTERFFRAGYNANLLTSWLPALDGVIGKLERGGSAADVGCGHGASTILMAKAFPKSHFVGYDYHGPSIEVARKRATDRPCGAPKPAAGTVRRGRDRRRDGPRPPPPLRRAGELTHTNPLPGQRPPAMAPSPRQS